MQIVCNFLCRIPGSVVNFFGYLLNRVVCLIDYLSGTAKKTAEKTGEVFRKTLNKDGTGLKDDTGPVGSSDFKAKGSIPSPSLSSSSPTTVDKDEIGTNTNVFLDPEQGNLQDPGQGNLQDPGQGNLQDQETGVVGSNSSNQKKNIQSDEQIKEKKFLDKVNIESRILILRIEERLIQAKGNRRTCEAWLYINKEDLNLLAPAIQKNLEERFSKKGAKVVISFRYMVPREEDAPDAQVLCIFDAFWEYTEGLFLGADPEKIKKITRDAPAKINNCGYYKFKYITTDSRLADEISQSLKSHHVSNGLDVVVSHKISKTLTFNYNTGLYGEYDNPESEIDDLEGIDCYEFTVVNSNWKNT
jgi:hypothetical protein